MTTIGTTYQAAVALSALLFVSFAPVAAKATEAPAAHPVTYSSYLGTPKDEAMRGMTSDAAGNLVLVGSTDGRAFPITPGALQPDMGGGPDAFVAKVSADGQSLLFATYLGGDGYDAAYDVAVDAAGVIHVTGVTSSTNMPVTPGGQAFAGGTDAFVATIAADGSSLLRWTYLGGTEIETGVGIEVDIDGSVVVAGQSWSDDFPTLNAFQPAFGEPGIGFDGFVTRYEPSGTVTFSTYLGGSAQDWLIGLALSRGRACVSGATRSQDFPLKSSLQPALDATDPRDLFVACFRTGRSLAFSTLVGGALEETGGALAVDARGDLHVVGSSRSSDFPTVAPFQAALGGTTGQPDAVVVELAADGSRLLASTYFGGVDEDLATAVAVGPTGAPVVTGTTRSANLPVQDPFQPAGGGVDTFVAQLSQNGSRLLRGSPFGGAGYEQSTAVGVVGDDVVLAGITYGGLPTVAALQPKYRSQGNFVPSHTDGFFARIDWQATATADVVEFVKDTFITDESIYVTRVRVVRSGSGYGGVCVGYHASPGTATEEIDYRPQPYVACWNSGETGARPLDIVVLGDNAIEGPETVFLELDRLSGFAVSGPLATATLQINDA